MARSKGEAEFLLQAKALGLPAPTEQYRLFAEIVGKGRGSRIKMAERGFSDYRYDFAWPKLKILVEINGAIWRKGGHNTGKGLIRDYDKINQAQMQGWDVFIFTTQQVMNGQAIQTMQRLMGEL